MKKKILISVVIVLTLVVIGSLAYKVTMLKSQNEDLRAENIRLSNRNDILRRQLRREITREDDLRDGGSCPVCRSDSVRRINYGAIYGNCVIYEWSKRYVCQKCRYKWGVESKLMQ
jgi:transposase-like protein